MVDPIVENIVHKEMNRARGRLAGLIESWGLDEHREHAMIRVMKDLSYESEKAIIAALEQHSK